MKWVSKRGENFYIRQVWVGDDMLTVEGEKTKSNWENGWASQFR